MDLEIIQSEESEDHINVEKTTQESTDRTNDPLLVIENDAKSNDWTDEQIAHLL